MKGPNQTERFRDVCRHLLASGIKPTPTVLETFETSFVTREGTNIRLSHGRLSKIRQEEFKNAGWTKERRGRFDDVRWKPPK